MRGLLLLLPLLAFLGGTAVAVQFAVHSELRGAAKGPLAAATISFVVGTAVLLVVFAASRQVVPAPADLVAAPWWAWLGGFLGAFYVFASIVVTPRLGAAATVGFVVSGQLIASIVLDHFGLLNLPAHAANPVRLAGVALVLVGAVIVLRT